MSFVIATPEFVMAAATNLAGIGSSLSAAKRGRGDPDYGSAGRGRG
jgi:PE family